LQTDEKNRFSVETVKAMIVVKTRFKNYSCNESCNILLKDNKLLDAISSSQKYTRTTEEEIGKPSLSK